MKKRLAKVVVLVLAAALLLTVPGLVGCGGGTSAESRQIIIGILTDFTGPASFAVRPTMDGYMDGFKWFQENDPIPGVEIKFITYDQRTDPGRVPAGYQWLKGKGATMMYIISPTDRSLLADKFTQDQMPCEGSSLDELSPNHPWSFAGWGSNGMEMETAMQWVMDHWDYSGKGRSPKIGHLSWTSASGKFHQWGADRMLQWYPDKFDWKGEEAVPMGTSTFAGEVAKLKDCDYIWITPAGTMPAFFVKEARARGYTGALLGGSNAFSGYWNLIRDAVAADQLYESYQIQWWPWWNEDLPLIDTAREIVLAYHADDTEARLSHSGPFSGLMNAMMAIEALKHAVAAVGAENVDGPAIRDGFLAINMTVEGFGNVWRYTEKNHCLVRTMRMFKWDIAAADWKDTNTGWISPRSLAE